MADLIVNRWTVSDHRKTRQVAWRWSIKACDTRLIVLCHKDHSPGCRHAPNARSMMKRFEDEARALAKVIPPEYCSVFDTENLKARLPGSWQYLTGGVWHF